MATYYLLDVDFAFFNKVPSVRLLVKCEDGSAKRFYEQSFEPYFFVKPKDGSDVDSIKKSIQDISAVDKGEKIAVKRVEECEKNFFFKKVPLVKVIAFNPGHVPNLREECRKYGEIFEADIPFYKRFIFDKNLTPCGLVEIEAKDLIASSVKPGQEDEFDAKLNKISLDIETYNPRGMPDAKKDACLMIGYACEQEKGVFSFSKKFSQTFVKTLDSEKQMLEHFAEFLREKKIDVICTYNGDVFDLPYLQERANALKADFRVGRDKSRIKSKKTGLRIVSRIGGRVHYDVFPVVSFLNFIGTIKVSNLTLDRVYSEVLGGKKLDVGKESIWQIWDKGSTSELDHLADYCLTDAVACLELTNNFMHLQTELGKYVGLTLFDTARATATQLVEALLIKKAYERNELVPNKPDSEETKKRYREPIQGAFVKMPTAGVYDNIAVLDFKSLYPSIIISHNIDATTLNCGCCTKEEAFVSPQGYRFCKKNKGIIPTVLNNVLTTRFKIQQHMKTLSKDSSEYKQLYARQWGLKILANSMYGYLLYARSRWYTREGGEATTAWARYYIQETIKKAEEAGLTVLYSDTDSTFLQYPIGEEKKITEFQKKINSSLPERMELELEDLYPRGIFVSKKQQAAKGAKKKYALINREGKIKIRGFELVRRDWSPVARKTQRQVLEILLKEGDVKKAVTLVKDVVTKLKEGKTPFEELAIMTQLKKKTSSYEIMSPEVSAVIKARKAGLNIPENSVVSYVITKSGKSISDKAQVLELAKDYDADYYISHQVLPAVLKLLSSLGIDEDDIIHVGSQSSLSSW